MKLRHNQKSAIGNAIKENAAQFCKRGKCEIRKCGKICCRVETAGSSAIESQE